MIRQWVRKWIGPSRAELRAEADLWRGRCERSNADTREAHRNARAAVREAGIERGRANELADKLRNAEQRIALASEPERRDGCTKVRLHRRAEAEQWATQIIEETHGQVGELGIYQCRICPRSPVTMQRYWHAGHSTAKAKAKSVARRGGDILAARQNGLTIGQRVDPSVLAKLRSGS